MKRCVAVLVIILLSVTALQKVSNTDAAGAATAGWQEVSTDSSGLAKDTAVSAVAIDPKNSSVIYAGTDFSGVYKSTDAGASWRSISSSVPDMANVLSLAIDPQKTSTLYAGLFNFGRPRIYKSEDAGLSWKVLDQAPQYPVYTLTIDPNHTSVIYAYSYSSGCYRSDDGGATWKRLNLNTVNYKGCCIAIDPKDSGVVYIVQYGSISKSEDRGERWTSLQVGSVAAMYVAVDPVGSGALYASTDGLGVFSSTDEGKTWTQTSLSNANATSIAIDAAHPGTMFAIDNTRRAIEETSDGWDKWRYSDLTGLPTAMQRDSSTGKEALRALAVDATGTLFLGTARGLFKYAAPAAPALHLTITATPTDCGSVARSPDQTAYALGATVVLTATPALGCRFVRWTGVEADTSDPLKVTITMDTDRAVTAAFEPIVNPRPAAVLLAPADGSTVAPGSVTFAWSPVSTATQYEFVLYNHFGDAAADSIITGTSVTYDLGLIETLTWKVRAGNDSGSWTDWSPVWSLIIQPSTTVPATVELSSPDDGTTLVTSAVTLSWRSAFGATGYNVALDTSSAFTNPIIWSVISTSQTTGALSQNTTYYWRVASVNAGGFSPWSRTFRFMTRTAPVTLTLTLKMGSTKMQVSGSDGTSDVVLLDAAPVLGAGNRTLVPVRAVAEAMGGTVDWNAATKTASISVGSNTLELTLGKSTAYYNGVATPIDTDPKVVPVIINGRTMLPLRFVTESLGAMVDWEQSTQTITITYQPYGV